MRDRQIVESGQAGCRDRTRQVVALVRALPGIVHGENRGVAGGPQELVEVVSLDLGRPGERRTQLKHGFDLRIVPLTVHIFGHIPGVHSTEFRDLVSAERAHLDEMVKSAPERSATWHQQGAVVARQFAGLAAGWCTCV